METDRKVISVLGGAKAGAAFLARDTFSDVDDTELSAHVMDVGSGWRQDGISLSSKFFIKGNTLSSVNPAAPTTAYIPWYVIDTVTEHIRVSVDIRWDVLPTALRTIELMVRYGDPSNRWAAQFQHRGDTVDVKLLEVVAGAQSARASALGVAAPAVGVPFRMTITAQGPTMSIAIPELGVDLSYGQALNIPGTLIGLRDNSGSERPFFDNFEATEP